MCEFAICLLVLECNCVRVFVFDLVCKGVLVYGCMCMPVFVYELVCKSVLVYVFVIELVCNSMSLCARVCLYMSVLLRVCVPTHAGADGSSREDFAAAREQQLLLVGGLSQLQLHC